MSHISEWSNRCCFVWAVERPVVGRTRYSPIFEVEGNGLRLDFLRDGSYCLKLTSCQSMSFNVSVHVEDTNRRLLPLDSYCSCYGLVDVNVWKYTKSDILKAIPDFLTNGLLLFVITIDNQPHTYKFTLQPPRSIGKKDKSVQTPSCFSVNPFLEDLSTDLSNLLKEDSQPDVVLTCGDLNLRAHKNVLSCRSRVFSAMLRNNMTEDLTGQVQITDMDSGILEAFVRYLYIGKLPDLTEEKVRLLYEAADKYAVVGLQKCCASFFLEILSHENACEILALADAHGDQEFKESVQVYILQEEIPHLDEEWSPFCDRHPKLAVEVLNRFYKKQKTA